MQENERLHLTLAAFDAANANDPNVERHQGKEIPRELLYSQLMTARLSAFAPEASEVLRLAAHAQHLCRWEIARSEYPMGRAGYYAWRERLGEYHGERAGEIMNAQGYADESIERVQYLLRKENLKTDPETQCLEDVICLVFLEYYFEDFAAKHDEDKVLDIVRKTWRKMSEEGQEAALELNLSDYALDLVKRALRGL